MARMGLPLRFSLRGLFACVYPLLAPFTAHAQEPPRAVVFRTASAAADMDMAAAVDPLVLAGVNDRGDLRVAERPALDLQATQIALDCVGETPACLSAVLRHYARATVLIAPSIQRADDETVVTFLYFDARGAGEFRTVVGRYRGEKVAHQALDAVPSMLRALLNPDAAPATDALPKPMTNSVASPAAKSPAVVLPPPVQTSSAATDGGDAAAFPLLPVTLIASAAVVAGVGVAFGFAADRSERAYHEASAQDDRAVDAAIAVRDRAHREALVANVSYGVAAAAFALGATLLVVDLTSSASAEERGRDTARATLSASIAEGELGLALSGHLPRGW